MTIKKRLLTWLFRSAITAVISLMQRFIISCPGVVTPMNKQFINISEQHILFIIIGNGYLIFKGFDIVFIIGIDDETFPDYRAVRSGGVELTQEKNNLYVAFTRSKRWLYVTWPENRTMPWGGSKRREISRFLVNFSPCFSSNSIQKVSMMFSVILVIK
jgi:hypothetical protein